MLKLTIGFLVQFKILDSPSNFVRIVQSQVVHFFIRNVNFHISNHRIIHIFIFVSNFVCFSYLFGVSLRPACSVVIFSCLQFFFSLPPFLIISLLPQLPGGPKHKPHSVSDFFESDRHPDTQVARSQSDSRKRDCDSHKVSRNMRHIIIVGNLCKLKLVL